jgi:hypothetical protein
MTPGEVLLVGQVLDLSGVLKITCCKTNSGHNHQYLRLAYLPRET